MALCVKITFPTKIALTTFFSKALHCTIPKRTVPGDKEEIIQEFSPLILPFKAVAMCIGLSCSLPVLSLRLLVFCTKVLLLSLAMVSLCVRYTTL